VINILHVVVVFQSIHQTSKLTHGIFIQRNGIERLNRQFACGEFGNTDSFECFLQFVEIRRSSSCGDSFFIGLDIFGINIIFDAGFKNLIFRYPFGSNNGDAFKQERYTAAYT
jgi:uncharacterized SAM-dependent methyltransferase